MKTLIIYTDFGNGHKSAAYNIASQLEGDVFLHNTRREKSPKTTKLIEYFYEELFLKNASSKIISGFYGFLYKFLNSSQFILDLFVVKTSNKKIYELINKYNPDLIIFTFPQKIETDIPILITLTDYSFSNCWFLKKEYFYTINEEKSEEHLVKKGVKKENIFLTGIPTKKEFDKDNKVKKFKNILFNLGAKGYCDFDILCKNIDTLLKDDFLIEVMCGRNNKLFDKLNKRYGNKIVIYPFVNSVDKVLDKNHLVITKAGGLSIAECISSKRPIILNSTQSLNGQEKDNISFVLENGLGKVSNFKDIAKTIKELNDSEYINMVNNIDKMKNNYKKLDIIDIVKEISKNGE